VEACPGADAQHRTHWVFPVRSYDRNALVAALRRAGFDAATGTSSIAVIPPPNARPELRPRNAERLMAEIVFLPAYPELGERELSRLARTIGDER
jgi:dTDP-4-amino-4,6-dideoxygalactose transaminase